MKRGDKVMVYEDPMTCEKPEGEATVTKVLYEETWVDAKDRPVFRCNVRFKGEQCSYIRVVSEFAG